MRTRIPVAPLLLLALIYVGLGDRFLPRAIGQYSTQARNTVNQLLIDSLPQWRPKANPNQRTESSVESLEKRK
jgi:hypothetical protein